MIKRDTDVELVSNLQGHNQSENWAHERLASISNCLNIWIKVIYLIW